VLVLLVVFGFGAPGVGEYAAQVTRGSRAAVAIWRSRDAAVAARVLRADCSRRAVGKQNRSGIVSAALVPACSA